MANQQPDYFFTASMNGGETLLFHDNHLYGSKDRHGQWKCREEECIGKCQIRNNRIIIISGHNANCIVNLNMPEIESSIEAVVDIAVDEDTFKPATQQLLNELRTATEAYSNLRNDRRILLDSENKRDYIYRMAALNGHYKITENDTKIILESNKVNGGPYRIENIERLMAFSRATDYILTLLDATLTKEILLMAHQTILGYIPMKAGKLRQIYVHIPNDSGNFIPMHPDHVPKAIYNFIRWFNECDQLMKDNELHPVLFACHVYYRIVFIHGFRDGNGRLARLMAAFVLKRAHHPYPFPLIDYDLRATHYVRYTRDAIVTGDLGKFVKWFGQLLLDQLNTTLRDEQEETTFSDSDSNSNSN